MLAGDIATTLNRLNHLKIWSFLFGGAYLGGLIETFATETFVRIPCPYLGPPSVTHWSAAFFHVKLSSGRNRKQSAPYFRQRSSGQEPTTTAGVVGMGTVGI